MEIQKNTVLAALIGVVIGMLISGGAIQYATFAARGIPANYAKDMESVRSFGDFNRVYSLPRIQDRIEDQGQVVIDRGSAPEESECDKFSGQRYTRCKAAEEEGIIYQPQDSRGR